MIKIRVYKDVSGYFTSNIYLDVPKKHACVLSVSGNFVSVKYLKSHSSWSFNSVRDLQRKLAKAIDAIGKNRKDFDLINYF